MLKGKQEWPECPVCHSKETVGQKMVGDKRKAPDGFVAMNHTVEFLDNPNISPFPESLIKSVDICWNCGLERYTRVLRVKGAVTIQPGQGKMPRRTR